MIPRIN